MAILNNLLVKSSSRFIGTSYFQDVSIAGSAALASLSLSGTLSVTGATTLSGTLGVTGAATFGNITATGTVVFSKTQDLSGTANSSPALIVGGVATAAHMELDANEIHAKENGTKVADLYLNNQGGKVYLSGNSVYASGSTFVTPTAAINNATISGDLTVNGVLHSNEFIKNIVKAVGGQLYVSPTFQATSSTTISCTSADTSYVYLTLQDNGITSSEYAGATWYSGSKIMLSGTLTANTTGHTEEILFSSAPGELTAQMNGGTNGAKKLQIKVEHDNASTYFKAGSLTFSDVAVMMYQLKNGGNYFPIGIYIKAYGTDNQKSYIDIFGGSDTTPNARLGLLTGLGSMPSGSTIQGWGIYTDNGFFKGIIEANGGLIGNWTIGTTGMYYNSDAPGSTSITMIPGGTAASTTSIGGSSGSKQWIFTGKNLFGIDTTGKLYASSAEISGKITATSGSIAGWRIESTYLASGTATAPAANTLLLSPAGTSSSYTVAGTAKSGWMITAGTTFGVNKDGGVYANSGKIGGWTVDATKIYSGSHSTWDSTAEDGLYLGNDGIAGGSGGIWYLWKDGSAKIGAMTLSAAGVLSVPAANITGTLTASQIGANQITAEKLSVTVGGNNLLRNSHQSISNGDYAFGDWYFGPNPPQEGDLVTFQLKGTLASTKTRFCVYNSGGNVKPSGTNSLTYDSSTGIYSATFNWRITQGSYTASNTFLRVYAFSSSQSGTSSCEWVKLEYGDVATPWSPSPDEAGGFDIDSTSIHTANVAVTSNADNSVALSSADFTRTINGTSRAGLRFAIGDKFGVTGDGTIYAGSANISGTLTAEANSEIGPWHVTSSSIYKANATMGASTSGAAYFGNDGLSVTNKFKVTSAGALTATGVDLSGKITATEGTIGGFDITSTAIKTKNVAVTSNADNSISLSSADFNRTINSTPRQGLRFAIGDKFGVTGDGTIYAGSANISGTLTAEANSQIGPWYVTKTSIYKGENKLGSTTSGAAYFGNLGLSIGNKFKVDASGDGAIILGELATGKTHIEVDSDSFDVCYGASTGSSAVKVATFGEITRIGNGGSNVLIDGSGFSFTNTDGVEMMKISTDNVVIGKEGSSYFYVDSNSITLKDNENADVFKVESGGGVTETGTYTERRGAKFQGNEFNNGCDIQRYDNGVRSSANKVWLRFYKKYTYQVIIEGTTYTRTGLRLNASKDLPSTYYQSGYDPNTLVSVHISGGNNGGTKYINDLVDQYCDSTNPTFDIMFSATCKTPSYANLNMDGNMVVTGSIAADKIQSNEIEATGSLTAPGLIFSPTGMNINEVQTANKNVIITSSNKIDSKPAIGASLTLYSGVYLLVAHGDFNSGSSSGIRTNQIAIYTGTNPVNTDLLNASRVRVTNAAAYWSGLTTHAIVTVPFNTGNTYTVGLTSSIAQSRSSSTVLQAVYLQPTYPDPDD